MPYGFIVLVAVIALALWYVVATDTSLLSKAIVLGVLGVCLVCRFWLHRFLLASLFLMVGLGTYMAIYRLYLQARFSDRHR